MSKRMLSEEIRLSNVMAKYVRSEIQKCEHETEFKGCKEVIVELRRKIMNLISFGGVELYTRALLR